MMARISYYLGKAYLVGYWSFHSDRLLSTSCTDDVAEDWVLLYNLTSTLAEDWVFLCNLTSTYLFGVYFMYRQQFNNDICPAIRNQIFDKSN